MTLSAPTRPCSTRKRTRARPQRLGGAVTPALAAVLGVCSTCPSTVCAEDVPVTATAESSTLPLGGVLLVREGAHYRVCTEELPCGPGTSRGIWWDLAAARTLATGYRASREQGMLTGDLEIKVSLLQERLELWQDISNKKDIAITVMSAEVDKANARSRLSDEKAAKAAKANLWWLVGGALVTAISVGLGALL